MNLFNLKYFLLILVVCLSSVMRLYRLDAFPVSLYTDEADQGYNAYSVLKTGKDEHGQFLPVSFRSFGDWKPPIQTYLMIPFISLLGLNEWSVRLPAVVLGICTVLLVYSFVLQVFLTGRFRQKIALLSAWYIAVSPWHILQSRSAMLVAVTLFFLLLGIYCWIKYKSEVKWLIFSAISFSLAIYSYYGMRVIVPFVLLFLVSRFIIRHVGDISVRQIRDLTIAAITGTVLLLPLLIAFIRQPDVVLGRARTVSIFYDQGIKLRQWELQTQDGTQADPLVTRYFHNSPAMYGRDIIRRFVSHVDPWYLLFQGDQNQPFQISNMGILYAADILYLIVGIYCIFRFKYENRFLLTVLFLSSYIPAALTFVTPASNRTFTAVLPIAICVAAGLSYAMSHRNIRIPVALLSTALYVICFGYFLRQYFVVMPVNHYDWWNWGWKETVKYIEKNQDKYSTIAIWEKAGMPYIYFLFYQPVSPTLYQNSAVRTYVADEFGFEHVEAFGKYLFIREREWKDIKNDLQPDTLYVIPASVAPENDYMTVINGPDGKPFMKFFAHETK